MKTAIKILKAAKKYHIYLYITAIATILNSVLSLYTPRLISSLVNLIAEDATRLPTEAPRLALIFLLIAFGIFVTQAIKVYVSHYAAWSFVEELRNKLYDHIQRLSPGYFSDKQTGQLMSRVINDTLTMELFTAHCAPDILAHSVMFFGVIIMLLSMNVRLAVYAILTLPVVGVCVWFYAKKVRPLFNNRHQTVAEINGTLQDNFSGVKEIQIFNCQDRERDRFAEKTHQYTHLTMKAFEKSSIVHPFIGFLNQLGTVLVIGIGGIMAAKGEIDAGEVVAFLLYLSSLYAPINSLARTNEDLQDSLAAGERIFNMLEVRSDVSDKEGAITIGRAKGEIEFKNVSFSYNDSTEVLSGFSLKINEGETIALVGSTGVGKTTLASLITRFYDPTAGSVTLDGVDLRDMTLHSLHENISMVLQDVFLFHGTVSENIRYGAPDATDEEVKNAAALANADGFITELEHGYDTIVGERGVRLSGGQKQRIAIARAILRNRPILILDEATSAVDNRTERLIHKAIDTVIENRTTIIIAHRLSTIKNADKIVVIENGTVKEMGSHEELLELNGAYKKLYETGLNA
ncbi:MAG: ABC transporter ATP-binding protein [Clostridia bacterium]|nr:ABC transporter ATP-binding protein [Clostridia bacterium]